MRKLKKSESSTESGMAKGANAMMAMSPAVASAWGGVFAEGTRFLAHRLRQDLESQKAMLECKSATEFLQV